MELIKQLELIIIKLFSLSNNIFQLLTEVMSHDFRLKHNILQIRIVTVMYEIKCIIVGMDIKNTKNIKKGN